MMGGGWKFVAGCWVAFALVNCDGDVRDRSGSGLPDGGPSTGGAGGECTGVDLTNDPLHCGACENVCLPVVMASGQANRSAIAVDGTNVYWTNLAEEGSVMKMPLAGGAPVVLATAEFPWDLEVDETSLYWTLPRASAIMKMPLAGGAPAVLLSGDDVGRTVAFTIDGTHAYWGRDDGAIMKLPLDGGTPIALASGSEGARSITVDSTHVYWTTGFGDGGTLTKVPLEGGAPTRLASGLHTPEHVVVVGKYVYWADYTDDTILKVPVSGGTPEIVATGQFAPSDLAVDDTGLYWVTLQGDGFLMKASLEDGSQTVIASAQDGPVALALAKTNIYWTTATGNVMRLGTCSDSECR